MVCVSFGAEMSHDDKGLWEATSNQCDHWLCPLRQWFEGWEGDLFGLPTFGPFFHVGDHVFCLKVPNDRKGHVVGMVVHVVKRHEVLAFDVVDTVWRGGFRPAAIFAIQQRSELAKC